MDVEKVPEIIRVLLVGPESTAENVRDLLSESMDTSFDVMHAETPLEAVNACIRSRPDCVLILDFGEAPSAETIIANISEETGNVPAPVVILTDTLNERRVAQTLKTGAQDCVLLDHVDAVLLDRSIHHAMARKRVEERLVRSALYDELTGLPTRTVFFDRLHVAIQRTRRTKGFRFAVAFLDLNDFKEINDKRGHLAGDRVLAETARRLKRCLRPGDIVARFGGDEFVVLADDVDTDTAATHLAERIVGALAEPVDYSGDRIPVSGSVGFSFGGNNHCSAEEIIEEADAAMYLAKHLDTHIALAATPGRSSMLGDHAHADRVLEALERDQLLLHYHPIHRTSDHSIIAMEALLRWRHPEDGLIPADAFLREPSLDGVAEPVEAWVVQRACADVARWKTAGLRAPARVNLSLEALVGHRLEARITAEVNATGLESTDIGFEVSGDMAGLDADAIIERLKALQAQGHEIAIEGFGEASVSIDRLTALPFDVFKIGRRIAAEIEHSPDHAASLRRLVTIARSLGGSAVAQGIETELQHEAFKQAGVDALQGFLFSRPRPLDDILASLAGRRPSKVGRAKPLLRHNHRPTTE